MDYKLTAKLLSATSSDDVKKLIHLYIQQDTELRELRESLHWKTSLISILEAENKILKETSFKENN